MRVAKFGKNMPNCTLDERILLFSASEHDIIIIYVHFEKLPPRVTRHSHCQEMNEVRMQGARVSNVGGWEHFSLATNEPSREMNAITVNLL